MSSYRPHYGNPYDYPPPPPPSYSMPPLPPGPPPAYDSYRGGDSYRPPQSDFTYRNENFAPQYPREQDYLRPTRSQDYGRQEHGRSQRRNNFKDNANLNQSRRANGNKGHQNHRAAPANRPLLRHHDQGDFSEQMLGMSQGQKFMAAEDVSDSEEEQMDESGSDSGESVPNLERADVVSLGKGVNSDVEESLEPPLKRRALTSVSNHLQEGSSEPKWSNPDPYTVLPPVDEATRKRKDVVKLIRKARKEAEVNTTGSNQAAANDDFISFGVDGDDISASRSPSAEVDDYGGLGVPGAPSGPRSFSHLHNLHGRDERSDLNRPVQAASIDGNGAAHGSVRSPSRGPGEILLDLGPHSSGPTSYRNGDENLGNRKRTYDDSIKGSKKNSAHNNGSILRNWAPTPDVDPIPWLRRAETFTTNAGFRLHKEICDFYDFVQPKDFEQTVRQELLSRLQTNVTDHIPDTKVCCFGSFAAGLYLPTADMDVVVISSTFHTSGRKVICQTKNQMFRFAHWLDASGLAKSRCEVIFSAKVPIIKFVDRLTGIRVDVSFENDTGVIANDTFLDWKKEFPAMPILVTIIKQFLMMRGLNEVQHGGLGGFSVTCLVTSLLQNMPRVQVGDIIPEDHLGEMLLEFLDFYGNRLDTSRTGISMRPPGYFEKVIRTNKHGSTYRNNKADRLAIMDPNRADNDISGGSREVMLIFNHFAKAHKEILLAMSDPSRISLLDWLLGGNYESFAVQRSHLVRLYQAKWRPQAEIPARKPLEEIRHFGNELLNNSTEEGTNSSDMINIKPSKSSKGPADLKPNQQRAVDLKTKYPKMQVMRSKVTTQRELKLLREYAATGGSLVQEDLEKVGQCTAGERRALRLKEMYPDMKRIPDTVGPRQRKKLIDAYEQSKNARRRRKEARAGEDVQPTLPKQYTGFSYVSAQRALALQRMFPDMQGIPRGVDRQEIKSLILNRPGEDMKSATKATKEVLNVAKGRLKELQLRQKNPDMRGIPESASEGQRQSPRKASKKSKDKIKDATVHGENLETSTLPHPPVTNPTQPDPTVKSLRSATSSRMAPLSDERRAEVARNLSGHSNSDPITLD